MDQGIVFLSSSSDTLPERTRALRVIDRLGDQLGIQPTQDSEGKSRQIAYAYERDDDLGGSALPIQEQILRTSNKAVELVVIIVGERVGLPLSRVQDFSKAQNVVDFVDQLKPNFCMPSDANGADATVITGLLFEVFDALSAGKEVLFFCKGDSNHIFNFDTFDLAERRFGGGSYAEAFRARVRTQYDRDLNQLESDYLREQQLGVKRLYDEIIKNYERHCFSSLTEFEEKLETALRAKLSASEEKQPDQYLRGLKPFSISDRNAFFGRKDEIEETFELLRANYEDPLRSPVLVVHGQSGVGKSSFLFAGIGGSLAELQEQGLGVPWGKGNESWHPIPVTLSRLRAQQIPDLPETGNRFRLLISLATLIEDELRMSDYSSEIIDRLVMTPDQETLIAALTGFIDLKGKSASNIVFLFDQTEDFLTAGLDDELEVFFSAVSAFCELRKACAVLCVTDTRPSEKMSPGWLEKWQSSQLAKVMGPAASYGLQHLGADTLVNIMKTTFAKAGVEVLSETKTAFRRRLRRFEANMRTHGLAVYDALPIFSVALQLSDERRRERIESATAVAIPKGRARRNQPAGETAPIQKGKTSALHVTDLVPFEDAIEELAESTFKRFAEEDLQLPWSSSFQDDPDIILQSAESVLFSVLSWLVQAEKQAVHVSAQDSAIDLSTIRSRPIEQRYIASRLGIDADKLVDRLLQARLLRRELQTEIRLSHIALVAAWSRAKKWLFAEFDHLNQYRSLCGFRDGGGNEPRAEQLDAWAALYAAWGVDGPWRQQARGSGSNAGTDRAWLKSKLLNRAHTAQNRGLVKETLWIAMSAQDDVLASEIVHLCSDDPQLRPILGSKPPASEDWRQAPPIVFAASRNLRGTVKALIASGVNPLLTDRLGKSCLHAFAELGDVENLKYLHKALENRVQKPVNRGQLVKFSGTITNGWTPFHSAALGGSLEALRELKALKAHLPKLVPGQVKLTSPRYPGATPMHLVARKSDKLASLMIAELLDLVDQRAISDGNGALPLHIAIFEDNARTCQELIDPALSAAKPKRSQIEVRMLPTVETGIGHNPLTLAARRNAAKAAKVLIDCGAIQQLGWTGGREAIRIAAGYGSTQVLDMLLNRAGDRRLPDLLADTDLSGRNALHLASQYRRTQELSRLLHHSDASEVINIQDRQMLQTALHWSVYYKDYDAAEATKESITILLKAGADPSVPNKDGLSAFELALAKHIVVGCQALYELGAAVYSAATILPVCLDVRSDEFVQDVIDQCAEDELAAGDEMGRTLLHHAAYRGNTAVINMLLDQRSDLVFAMDKNDHTPLHSAVLGNHTDAIELLIQRGASLSAVQSSSRNALHLAAYDSCYDAMSLILRKDREQKLGLIASQDKYGSTAIHASCDAGDPHATRLLLNHGADPTVKSAEGMRSPAHMAAHGGAIAVLELLKEHQPESVLGLPNEGKGTLLHSAALGGQFDTIDWLFKADGETAQRALFEPNEYGETPLGLAVRRWRKIRTKNSKGTMINFEEVGLPADADADGFDDDPIDDIEHEHELNAWRTVQRLERYAAETGTNRGVADPNILVQAVKARDSKAVRYFIDRGYVDLGEENGGGSALFSAIFTDQIESLMALLEIANETDLERVDRNGRTLLHFACRNGHKDLIAPLVSKGARLDAVDNFGSTPADLALWHGEHDTLTALKELARGGLSVFGPKTKLRLLDEHLSERRLDDLCELLAEEGSNELSLAATIAAARRADLEAVQRLRSEMSVELNARNENGLSPLFVGLRAGFEELASELTEEELLAAVAFEYARDASLFHAAAQGGCSKVIKRLMSLVDGQASIDKHGWTPIHYAAASLQVDVIRHFVSEPHESFSLTTVDNFGQTPLHKVGVWTNEGELQSTAVRETVQALLDGGADLLATDNRGRTASEYAESEGKALVSEYLSSLEREVRIEMDLTEDFKNIDSAVPSKASNKHALAVMMLILVLLGAIAVGLLLLKPDLLPALVR